MVPSYQFICQVREPIVFKQPEQEMLADSTVNTQPALLLHTRSRASGRGTGNAAYEAKFIGEGAHRSQMRLNSIWNRC